MSDVKIYTQADFPPILKWQVIAFMKTAWPGIFQGPLKFLTEPYPPQLNPVHFALCHDDALVSYATIMRQTWTHVGQQFDACCFGNMFTFPPYRHEGHALKVLQAATEYIHQSDADVAALFCREHLISFYAQCGWATMPVPTHVGMPQQYAVKEAPRMMLFVSAKGQAARQSFAAEALLVGWAW
ncbi:MAG: GNAT family N-acetyltransferase [Caldilineaceae bacterium]